MALTVMHLYIKVRTWAKCMIKFLFFFFLTKVAFDVDIDTIRDDNSPFPSSVSKSLEGIQESLRRPFWRISVSSFPFQRSVAKACQFIRNFARKVILERQEAVLRGENTPLDILAHILRVAEKEPSITVEDLIDDFTTFFVAGMSFSLLTYSVFFVSCKMYESSLFLLTFACTCLLFRKETIPLCTCQWLNNLFHRLCELTSFIYSRHVHVVSACPSIHF